MFRTVLVFAPLAVLVGCSSSEKPEPATAKLPEIKKGEVGLAPTKSEDLTPEGLAKLMDVPAYPGAEAPDGVTRPPAKDGYGGTRIELVLATKDPVKNVADFYKNKLKIDGFPQGSGMQLIGKTSKGNDLMIAIGPEAGRTMIRIKAIAYDAKKP